LKLKFRERNQYRFIEREKRYGTRKQKEVANYFKSDLDKNKAEIASLKSDISKKRKEVNSLYETYITEAEGTKGTLKLGKGPVLKKISTILLPQQLDTIRKTT
jgi:hypothetical protein